MAGGNVGNPKFVFRANIANSNTQDLITRALTEKKKTLVNWANKVVVGMDTNEGKAILASPNGRGIAWLLTNQKAQMGIKTIESVTVWADNFDNPNPGQHIPS